MNESVAYRDKEAFGKRKKIKVVSAIDKNYLEETYRRMAQEGWLVDEIKGLRDVYVPIEPCELDFAVKYGTAVGRVLICLRTYKRCSYVHCP